MLTFDMGPDRFNVRAAGLILDDGYVLLCQSHAAPDFWFLPGGRVELMEATPETVAREVSEELGTTAAIGPLQFVVENFFRLEGQRFHEIGFYYRATLQDPAFLDKERRWDGVVDGPYNINLRWFRLSDLDQVVLRPPFLREALHNLTDGVQHIVYVDKPSLGG